MDPGTILGGLAALSTAILGGLAALASARSKRATTDVETLTKHVQALDRQVVVLQAWQLAARLYIWQLRAVLADRGIAAPEPPPELGLTVHSEPFQE